MTEPPEAILLNTSMKVVKTELTDPNVLDGLLRSQEIFAQRDLKMLNRYKRGRKHGCEVEVVYHLGAGCEELQLGRLYAKDGQGIQAFPFDIRNPLCAKKYFDVDFDNCHYRLMSQSCKKWNLKCEAIDKYISNREKELEQVSSNRGVAKVAFLKVAYGGHIDLHFDNFKEDGIYPDGDKSLLNDIHKEIMTVISYLKGKYPTIYKFAAKKAKHKKPAGNPEFTLLAFMLQTEERKCLLALDEYLQSKGRSVDVLIHDGCYVRKLPGELAFPEEILDGVEEYVKKKTGYSIPVKVKPIEHNYSPPTSDKSQILSPDILIDDRFAAEKLYSLAKEFLGKKNGVVYAFDRTDGLWKDDLSPLVDQYWDKLIWKQYTLTGINRIDYGGCVRHRNDMLKFIPNFVEEKSFDAKSAIGKLLFKNGIYDFNTRVFTKGFDPTIFFKGRINRDFSPVRDVELEAKIYKLLFVDPYLTDQLPQAAFYLTAIARAIYGDYNAKRCYITVGRPNCGRGLLTLALTSAFESFVSIFNPGCLLHARNTGEDNPKANSWLVPLVNKRIIIGNEIELSGRYIDGNRLKSLSSGGDDIIARQNYENDTTFSIICTAFILLNDLPKIKPADEGLMNRICVNELRKTCKLAPADETEILEDRTLKEKFLQQTWLDAFFWIVADAWSAFAATDRSAPKPLALIEDTKEWVESDTSIKSLLEQGYEITKKEGDYVVSSHVYNFLRQRGCKESVTKMGREVGLLTGFLAKARYVNGKTCQTLSGVRRLEGVIDGMENIIE
jgi:hypothetical protein